MFLSHEDILSSEVSCLRGEVQTDLDADARRDLKAANAAQYVRDLVNDWPPLSDTQRAKLAVVLLGGGNRDDGAP